MNNFRISRAILNPVIILYMLTLLTEGCFPIPIPPSLLYGKEMVGKVTATTATIRLVAGDLCNASTTFRLYYDTVHRTDPNDYAYQTDVLSGFSKEDPISFDLTSLSPNTRYYYRLGYDNGEGWTYRDEFRFYTQRPPGTSFRFCIITDIHARAYPETETILHVPFLNMVASGPDILFSLGDDYDVATQGIDPPYLWNNKKIMMMNWWYLRSHLDFSCHSMFYVPVNGRPKQNG